MELPKKQPRDDLDALIDWYAKNSPGVRRTLEVKIPRSQLRVFCTGDIDGNAFEYRGHAIVCSVPLERETQRFRDEVAALRKKRGNGP